jgi:hypothetical protein
MNDIAIDLTTPQGRQNAIDLFDRFGWIVSWPVWLARQAFTVADAPATTEAQKNAVIEIIQAGRKNGVKKMSVKIDRTAGLDFGADIDGVPIKMKMGDSGTISIEVEYA